MQQTTAGWKLRVKLKDGMFIWKPLKDLKESNPIDIAEHVTAPGIQDEQKKIL